MIFDTHCHYNLSPLYENWQQHWQKAQDHEVIKSIIPGVNIETSQRAVEIAKQDKNLYAAVGIHPHEYNQFNSSELTTIIPQQITSLSTMLNNEKIIAIGETGLDYYRLKKEERKLAINNQKIALRMHIKLANKFDKILIIHSRDVGGEKTENNQAYWEILKIIKNDYQFKKPFILHCVSGPKEYIGEMLNLGAYIGVGGNVTYPNANELRALIKIVPENRILLETDVPYLPPQEFRGQICEPWMIEKTAVYLEKELKINPKQIYQNSLILS